MGYRTARVGAAMMSRFLLGLAALVAIASAQVQLTIRANGAVMGDASTSQRLLPDGQKRVEMRMTLKSGAQEVTIRTQNLYAADGSPVRKVTERIGPGDARVTTVATFDEEGARVVINDRSNRKTRQVTLAKTANRKRTSEFWWIRDVPKPGDTVTAYDFNMDTLEWELTDTTYVGIELVKVGGKSISAHRVVLNRAGKKATTFLDDQGQPIRIQMEGLSMERTTS